MIAVVKKVAFILPTRLGANPAVDMLLHGIAQTLQARDCALTVVQADGPGMTFADYPGAGIDAAVSRGVDAIAYYTIEAGSGRENVARARDANIPVFTIARTDFPVNGSLVYPGFQQGMFMMRHLLGLLPAGSRIGIVGGPNVLTDAEELAGLVFALERSGTHSLANDPFDPRYSNAKDDRSGAAIPVANLLDDHPDIAALVPYNDETMLGAIAYFRDSGRGLGLPMVSRNGTPEAIEAVRQGLTHGTWDLDVPNIGKAFGTMIADHLSGEKRLEDEAVMAPVGRMITQANIDLRSTWSKPDLGGLLSWK